MGDSLAPTWVLWLFIGFGILTLMPALAKLAWFWLTGPGQNAGERRLSRSIAGRFANQGWQIIDDLTLPTSDGTTQIDHVVATPGGLLVIETKHFSGWIFGDGQSKVWTQILGGKKFRFQNPLRQNHLHAQTVRAALPWLGPEKVVPVVVFTGSAEFKTPLPEGVFLFEHFLAWCATRAPNGELTSAQVERATSELQAYRLVRNGATHRRHVCYLQRNNRSSG